MEKASSVTSVLLLGTSTEEEADWVVEESAALGTTFDLSRGFRFRKTLQLLKLDVDCWRWTKTGLNRVALVSWGRVGLGRDRNRWPEQTVAPPAVLISQQIDRLALFVGVGRAEQRKRDWGTERKSGSCSSTAKFWITCPPYLSGIC